MTIIFTLVACFSNALSLILMKVSIEKVSQEHRKLHASNMEMKPEERQEIKQQSTVCNKWWISGFFFVVLGSVANIGAVGYGNLVLLASTSALTLLFSTLLSIKILGE